MDLELEDRGGEDVADELHRELGALAQVVATGHRSPVERHRCSVARPEEFAASVRELTTNPKGEGAFHTGATTAPTTEGVEQRSTGEWLPGSTGLGGWRWVEEHHGLILTAGCCTLVAGSLRGVTTAALSAGFIIGFSIFLIATIVLLVLTIRFIVARARADKAAWMAERGAEQGERHT